MGMVKAAWARGLIPASQAVGSDSCWPRTFSLHVLTLGSSPTTVKSASTYLTLGGTEPGRGYPFSLALRQVGTLLPAC